jgi:hypothetical protein
LNVAIFEGVSLNTQGSLISWFYQETGHQLNQSQISKILSPECAHLDNDTRRPSQLGSARHYKGDWPELEAALFEWQQRLQKKKTIITSDMIKGQASYIWNHLPQFEHLPEPTWSNGWLEGFKKRFRIKEYGRREKSNRSVGIAAAVRFYD